jgi:hypothetical protein
MNGEMVRERMDELYRQRDKHKKNMFKANSAIKELRERCPHENVEKDRAFEIEVYYDRDEDAENHRPIYEQYSTCKDCGKRWSEQFSAEDDENE